ncbi:YmL10, partial [Chytridiales sp. JEL 0842]
LVKPLSQYVHVNTVSDNKGAAKKRKRVGRGKGSGVGKTSRRGHKGLKARASKARPVPGYEGGQTGLLRAIPKLGHRVSQKLKLARLYLDTVQHWIDSGRLDASKKITIKHLVDSGCIGSVKDGVVLLAKGGHFLRDAIDIEVTHVTKTAINLIEARGGKVTCFDYDRKTLRALLKPEKFLGPPKPSLPTDTNIPARYFDPASRGYLAGQVEELLKLTKPKKQTA